MKVMKIMEVMKKEAAAPVKSRNGSFLREMAKRAKAAAATVEAVMHLHIAAAEALTNLATSEANQDRIGGGKISLSVKLSFIGQISH